MIPRGVMSTSFAMIFSISMSGIRPVPIVLTWIDTGWAMPMAYDTWMRHSSASPAATTFFARCRLA